MIQPSQPELSRVERMALALGRWTNERPLPKKAQWLFLNAVSRTWVRGVVARRTYVHGVEALCTLEPDRGVLLVANHRSFFDQYIAVLGLLDSGVPWIRALSFPVRANFFYERPAGVLINLLVGGGVMYPPIFRDAPRSELNRDALRRVVDFLRTPGHLAGMHPEGRRNKGPDPYSMLRAQPGVGEVILRARPLVVPLFIGGLGNDFLAQARRNFQSDARRSEPVILCFGPLLDYSEFTRERPRLTLYKRVADRAREEILRLGETERRLRSMARAGTLPDDDPGWLLERLRARRRGAVSPPCDAP